MVLLVIQTCFADICLFRRTRDVLADGKRGVINLFGIFGVSGGDRGEINLFGESLLILENLMSIPVNHKLYHDSG